MLPPFHARLFWRSEAPFQVEAHPAGAIHEFTQLKGFTSMTEDISVRGTAHE